MLNNYFNERINREFPKTFSICDIDGAMHCFSDSSTRLIFYEIKEKDEKISDTQLRLLKILRDGFDWSKYDDLSGVFIIQSVHDNTFDRIKVSDLENNTLKYLEFKDILTWFQK